MLNNQDLIGLLNIMISEICISRNCKEKEALDNYIVPFLIKEIRSRDVAIMGQKDLDILKLSVEDLKTTKKELNLLRNVIKTLEELMHGKN